MWLFCLYSEAKLQFLKNVVWLTLSKRCESFDNLNTGENWATGEKWTTNIRVVALYFFAELCKDFLK